MTERSKKLARDGTVRRMGLVCLVGFGGFLAWACFAPLEEGIAATGKIIVEDNRQQIQHFEGGIVEEILVREGSFVEAGQQLVILRKTASLANREQVAQEYAALKATTERLKALQAGARAPSFEALDNLDLDPKEKGDILARERELFEQERNALAADIAVLNARIDATREVETFKAKQFEIKQRALVSAREELTVFRSMVAEQLARRDQLTEAERLVASLEGELSVLRADEAEAQSDRRDLTTQIRQARARTLQRWATELSTASAKLLNAKEALGVTQDVLDRSVIVSPVSGEVLNLASSTVGGVVRSGDTLMEIVPRLAEVTAALQIMPTDRSSVHEGLTVRTQLSSYKGWQAPRLNGEIIGVSADLKTDPVTSISYYEARVLIPNAELARVENADIIPGMPVDTFIFAGRRRTLMQYITEPISDSLFRGLRQG